MGRRGIILFGHGSRDPLWHLPIASVAQRIRGEAVQLSVRLAFLELQPPDLATAVAELASEGVREVTIVPMFLGTGRHAREDLPLLLEAVRLAHPDIEFALRVPVGEDPRLLDLLAKMASE